MPRYKVTYKFFKAEWFVNSHLPNTGAPVVMIYRDVEAEDEGFAADQALFSICEYYTEKSSKRLTLFDPELISVVPYTS